MRTSVHIHGREPEQPRTRVVIHTDPDPNTRTTVEVQGAEGTTRELGDAMKTRVQIHGATRKREGGPYRGRDALNTRVVLEPPVAKRPNVTREPTDATKPIVNVMKMPEHITPRQAITILNEELQQAAADRDAAATKVEQISVALQEAARQDAEERAAGIEPEAEPEEATVIEVITGDEDTEAPKEPTDG